MVNVYIIFHVRSVIFKVNESLFVLLSFALKYWVPMILVGYFLP